MSLKEVILKFPKLPGVYIMKDEAGIVLYIGKAKNLRVRLKSYFSGSDERYQVEFFLKRVQSIEPIVTGSEQQALILERDLINKHKPKYNIRLKDDKAYLSIRIDPNVEWPKLELVRKVTSDSAYYFGPYSYSYEVRDLMDLINKLLPLRSCSDTVFYNRQRPCLEYQIKRCAGPCCLQVDPAEYRHWVKQAVSILEGKSDFLKKELERMMDIASEELRFEEAALYRDRLETLNNFQQGQKYSSATSDNWDVFVLYREEQLAALSVVKVINGRLAGNTNYDFAELAVSSQEVIESAIVQYYAEHPVPDQVLTNINFQNQEFISSYLSEKKGLKVEVSCPQRGLKYRLVELALLNARQHYLASFEADHRTREIQTKLATICNLSQVPRRIECLDISNFQGSDIVGAIVAYYDGSQRKDLYRKYVISKQGKPDDFAAVYEVVERRLKHAIKTGDFPDLLIIDGGKQQLSKALEAAMNLDVKIDIIALAKERSRTEKPERIFLPGAETAIDLPANQELTNFLASIRDEVHRYVISFHRAKRSKRVFASELDNVPGLGQERKLRLIKVYKTVAAIRLVSAEELAKAGKMPLLLARKLKDYLNSKL